MAMMRSETVQSVIDVAVGETDLDSTDDLGVRLDRRGDHAQRYTTGVCVGPHGLPGQGRIDGFGVDGRSEPFTCVVVDEVSGRVVDPYELLALYRVARDLYSFDVDGAVADHKSGDELSPALE